MWYKRLESRLQLEPKLAARSPLSAVSREQVPTGPDREWSRPVPTGTDRNLLEIKNPGGFLFVLKCGSSSKKKFNENEFALSVGTCTSRHIIINFIVLCRVCTRIIVGCLEKRRESHPLDLPHFSFVLRRCEFKAVFV